MVKKVQRKRADGTTYTRWVVDTWINLPGGERTRVRKDIPEKQVTTRAEAVSWAHAYINSLKSDEVKGQASPRLVDFWSKYEQHYCRANHNRQSTIDWKVRNFNTHVVPKLGKLRLHDIGRKELGRK